MYLGLSFSSGTDQDDKLPGAASGRVVLGALKGLEPGLSIKTGGKMLGTMVLP